MTPTDIRVLEKIAELRHLKIGDFVDCLISNKWTICTVVTALPPNLCYPKGCIDFSVRPNGLHLSGRRKRLIRIHHYTKIRKRYDGLTANVYADFLDERGFTDAANVLRQSFPLDNGEIK